MADAYITEAFRSSLGGQGSTTPAFTTFALNGTTDALEVILQAHKGATITRLGCRLGAITGTTPTYRISAQGVGSTGNPDGTLKGATNNAKKVFSPSALGWAAGSWNWLTLDETFDVARGDFFSIVIDYSSGTVDGSNFATFTSHHESPSHRSSLSYPIQNDATVRTRQARIPVIGYGSATEAFGFPIESISSAALTSSSNPREVGMRFVLPSGWGDTYKVVGVRWNSNQPTTGNFIMRLYDGGGASDTSVLQSVTIPCANWEGVAGDRRHRHAYFDETTLSTLTFGNAYRVSWEQDNASSNTFHYLEVDAVDDWFAWPGNQQLYWTQRASGGNWADTTTRRLTDFSLILDDITEPAGGGGGLLLHPGMSGGIRG